MSEQGETHMIMYLVVLVVAFLILGGMAYLFHSETARLYHSSQPNDKTLEKLQRELEKTNNRIANLKNGDETKNEELGEFQRKEDNAPKTLDMAFYYAYRRKKQDFKRLIADYSGINKLQKFIELNKKKIIEIRRTMEEYKRKNHKIMADIISAYKRVDPLLRYDRAKPIKSAMKSGGLFPYYLPKGKWTLKA